MFKERYVPLEEFADFMVNGLVQGKIYRKTLYLVGGLENGFYDFPVGNVIIPTDFHSIIGGVGQPPARYIINHH